MNGQIGSKRVLLVDDDSLVRCTVAALLEDLGFQVTEAGAPKEALEVVETAHEFDVLVTDVVMPGMDGWTFAEHIRARHPSMPVVYVSGYSTERTRPVEGSQIVWKPFSKKQLAQAIREVLRS
jgi:CheY-like chemotaxis protein